MMNHKQKNTISPKNVILQTGLMLFWGIFTAVLYIKYMEVIILFYRVQVRPPQSVLCPILDIAS